MPSVNRSPKELGQRSCAKFENGPHRPQAAGTIGRRAFLKATGIAVLAATFRKGGAVAGPFSPEEFANLVPADKRLDATWVESLFKRGVPEVWRGAELENIGMPIGGIGCGQLYLGGDGRLWHWRIFDPAYSTDYATVTAGPHYARPLKPESPIDQGFAIKVTVDGKTQVRELSSRGFAEVQFRGEYPIGKVSYRDPECPVSVNLEAFSPFIPLAPEASGLPATVMEYHVTNNGAREVEISVAGWLQNSVCPYDDQPSLGVRRNRVVRQDRSLVLECSVEPPLVKKRQERRPDILFEDFEQETYGDWIVEGSAFGERPVESSAMPEYQGEVGAHGKRLVNSHNTRGGEDVIGGDAHTGRLISRPFVIERDFITFLIGGGKHPGKTCLNLLVDGKVMATSAGQNENRMREDCFDVTALSGATAQLQIVDDAQGGWGNVGIDHIVFTDEIPAHRRLDQLPGFGTMALALLRSQRGDTGAAAVGLPVTGSSVFSALRERKTAPAVTTPFGQKLIGAVGGRRTLKAKQTATLRFLITWWFPYYPNPKGELAAIPDLARLRRRYAKDCASATDLAFYVGRHLDGLGSQTRLWNQTWYDSTLPYWFLDRTFIPIDSLATNTCHWFDNGRFYGWEGVECCPGTCQHVWQYAQAMARVFPQLERDLRERVDFGLAWHENGAMDYRAENARQVAHDGFAGTLLRVYREHQMSPDTRFLRRLWPRVRKSIEFLMGQDKNENGLLDGEQYNTLDASWFGPMAWVSSLYLAALQAGAEMAREAGDEDFAGRCERLVGIGRQNIVAELFNGEYFIHKPDPKHPNATNTNDGCHIDQVFGQSYAWQLGLKRVIPVKETESALQSLWRYNFTPDVGFYRENFKSITTGRWYAMPGEGGLLMCTWPKGGAEKAPGNGNPTFVGYFNECMTGFEYQVAAHMLWEGLVKEGLAVTRTIHDRYHPSKRNPYNEIECSDHYARAMMSYGVFLAVCGYEYHGPKGHLGFIPRITPDDFRAPFTAAEGWGTLGQKREGEVQNNSIELKWGKLRLRSVAVGVAADSFPTEVKVTLGGRSVESKPRVVNNRVEIRLGTEVVLNAGQSLRIVIS